MLVAGVSPNGPVRRRSAEGSGTRGGWLLGEGCPLLVRLPIPWVTGWEAGGEACRRAGGGLFVAIVSVYFQ